jgi:hypothetical protein
MPALQTLTASRNATWAPQLAYDYPGADLPLDGATIAMQLRLYPGQPGNPKLSIEAIPFTDVPLSGVPGTDTERRRVTLSPAVTVAQLTALPGLQTPEAGDPQRFAFDILITYADGASEILSQGDFIVSPGVTIA